MYWKLHLCCTKPYQMVKVEGYLLKKTAGFPGRRRRCTSTVDSTRDRESTSEHTETGQEDKKITQETVPIAEGITWG